MYNTIRQEVRLFRSHRLAVLFQQTAGMIALADIVLAPWGIIVSPAIGAVLMSLSTIIVAINAKLLKA